MMRDREFIPDAVNGNAESNPKKLVKMFALMKRKNGMTHKEFIERYETGHAPLYLTYNNKNIVRYVRNYINVPEESSADGFARVLVYDSLTEFWFTEDGFRASMAYNPYAAVMVADEAEFVDRGASIYGLVDEYTSNLGEARHPENAGVKTIALLKRQNGTTHEEFRQHYEGKYVPLMKKLVGSTCGKYVRNYFIAPITQPVIMENSGAHKTFDFDAYTQCWCTDKENILARQTITANDQLIANGAKFVDHDQTIMFTVDEHVSNIDAYRK